MKPGTIRLSRRNLLGLAMAGASVAVSRSARASLGVTPARQLSFYNLHTGEKLNSTYWFDGRYIADELRNIDYLLRDFRTGEATGMDPRLFDLLFALRQKLGVREPFHVISGYRSRRTNASLREAGGGVAEHSLHTVGQAIDVRVPGRRLSEVGRAAIALAMGGVGYYPASNFVHLDTGRIRFW